MSGRTRVLALGLSTGTQLLTVNQVPNRYVEAGSFDFLHGPSLDELHWETRLERRFAVEPELLPLLRAMHDEANGKRTVVNMRRQKW